jgi:hypothetical protein
MAYYETNKILDVDIQAIATALALDPADNIDELTNSVGGENEGAYGGAGNKATFDDNLAPNGAGGADFGGSTQNDYSFGDIFDGLSEGSISYLLKCDAHPAAGDSTSGLHSTSADSATHCPYTDNNYYEGWGSTTRRNAGNSKTAISPGRDLSSTYRLITITSKAAEYKIYIDGVTLYSSVTNTVSFPATYRFGASDASKFFKGKLLRMRGHSVALSSAQVAQELDAYANEYQLSNLGYVIDPVAGFTIPANIDAGDSLIPTNTSTDATSYEWRVNGVLRSATEEPNLAKWLIDGENTVHLTALNTEGSDTAEDTVTVDRVVITVQSTDPLEHLVTSLQVGQKIVGRVRKKYLTGGGYSQWSGPAEVTAVDSGLLLKEDFASIGDWSANGSISAIEKPAMVAFNPSPIIYSATPASPDAGGVREAHWMRIGSTEYLFTGAGDGGGGATQPWRQQLAHRAVGDVTWTKDGPTSIGLMKTDDPGDGDWAARDNLFVYRDGSGNWFNLIMNANSVFGQGTPGEPYFSDAFKIASGDPVSNDNWEFVRAQFTAGVGGAFDNYGAYSGSVVESGGVFHHFYSGKDAPGAENWSAGYATSTAIDGVITRIGELPLEGQIENPKVFFSTGLNKWVMLCNQVSDDASHTDKNVLYVSESLTDWSSAVKYTFQKTVPATSLLDAIAQIGIPSPLYGVDGSVFESDEGNISFSYDAGSSPYVDAHNGRHIRFGGLEVSRYAARINNLTTTEHEIQRAVSHTDFHASFVVEVNSKSGSGTRGVWFGFRKTNSTDGSMYRVFITADGECTLEERATAGSFAEIADSSEVGGTIYENLSVSSSQGNLHRVQVIVAGGNVKVYLNGEKQVDHTDATIASGTYITLGGVGVDAYIRRFSMRASDTVTFTGLTPGDVVRVFGPGGYTYLAEDTADGSGEASFTLEHFPIERYTVNGVATEAQLWGGDTVDI